MDISFTSGNLMVKLAQSALEIEQAQKLRYDVFFDELGAKPSSQNKLQKMDKDQFDDICEHLVVVDIEKNLVIGNYRLLRYSVAKKNFGFYTEGEFDLSFLNSYEGEVLEVGRTCVHQDYRSSVTMQLLWKGLSAYMYEYDVQLLLGCASFHGTEVEPLKETLSYLCHYHAAPEQLRVSAKENARVKLDYISKDDLDRKTTFRQLPPLIKGYLRAGAYVSDSAFLDKEFNTLDVCILLETSLITDRYMRHYARTNKNS